MTERGHGGAKKNMNYAWIPLTTVLIGVACVPDSKDGGSVLESSGNSVETAEPTTGSAESSATTQTSATTEEGSTGEGSTTGGVPAACAQRGWDTSYETWQDAVAEADGQYSYVAETQTYLGKAEFGCRYHTTVRVANGAVIERVFTLIESADGADCEDDFAEVGDELGESDVPSAAPAVGLDQIYLDCCNNHLDLPEEDFLIQFDLDEAGLLQYCGAQILSCGESCELDEPGLIDIVSHEFGAQ